MLRANESFLKELVEAAKGRITSGYYSVKEQPRGRRVSLVEALRAKNRVPIIAEIKFRSPSQEIDVWGRDPVGIARSYERGGAAGISVLTEPEHFGGRLEYVSLVKEAVALPVMMKDIVVDMPQVKAAYCCGADAVLLIAGVFLGGMGAGSLAEMVRYVHEKSMEAVVEVHNEEEYTIAISGEADMVGINNRDLDSLSVSIDTSIRLLKKHPDSKPVICESGIASRKDIESLRSLGADGFLVGTALMNSSDKEGALREMSRR